MLTLPGVVLAVTGLAWFLPRDRTARLLMLPALSYSLFVFFFLRAAQLRYLLPLGLMLALFAGAAVDAAWRSSSRPRLALASGLFAAAGLIGLLRLVDLTHAMLRDSRYAAAEWLASRLRPGDRVEYFGASQKLPRIPAGVEVVRATPFHSMYGVHDTSASRADTIVTQWRLREPALVIVIPDHSSLWPDAPFDASVPPALFRQLESDSLPWRRLALFQTAPLLPWVRRPRLDYPMVNPPVRIYGLPARGRTRIAPITR
jgi:hypothetical protein